jgi:hypothetical protein
MGRKREQKAASFPAQSSHVPAELRSDGPSEEQLAAVIEEAMRKKDVGNICNSLRMLFEARKRSAVVGGMKFLQKTRLS